MTRFYRGAGQTMGDLRETFRKWGVTSWSAGLRGDEDRPGTPAIVVFRHPTGKTITLTSAHLDCYADNLRAIWQSLDQARKDEARGLGGLARSLYLQLPAPDEKTPPAAPQSQGRHDPYRVLGLVPGAPLEVAETVYRSMAKQFHPDTATKLDHDREFIRLQEAIRLIRWEHHEEMHGH